jgi:exodeoxyribonuclease V alpha subunit
MSKTDPHLFFGKAFPKALQNLAISLSRQLEEGHICIDLNDDNFLSLEETISAKPDKLCIIENEDDYKPEPFVLYKNKIYFNRYFRYESIILKKIKTLISLGKEKTKERILKLLGIKHFFNSLFSQNESTNLQSVAALSAYLNNFCIITGGPGTGKTTTVANLLAMLFFDNPELKVSIAAPTGKAAARINDSFKDFKNNLIEEQVVNKIKEVKALTIHRLLGGYQNFVHHEKNLLDTDLLIVDECSMIDAALMAKLLSALPDSCRLILLGDKNQLSAVEAGSIFADLCVAGLLNSAVYSPFFIQTFQQLTESNNTNLQTSTSHNLLTDCITELEKSRRFDDDKKIAIFSKKVIKGEKEMELKDYYHVSADEKQFVQIIPNDKLELQTEKVFRQLLVQIKDYIAEKDILKSFELLNNFKILCATREGNFGMNAINKLIENELNIKKINKTYYHKQPILITKNDLELEIFNGDIGIIIDENYGGEKPELIACFIVNGALKKIQLLHITDYETAFAMTIHKSQGSEYQNVYIFLPTDAENRILTRELLYTAVTRAKNSCYLYANEDVIRKTTNKQVSRVSGIIDRIIAQ